LVPCISLLSLIGWLNSIEECVETFSLLNNVIQVDWSVDGSDYFWNEKVHSHGLDMMDGLDTQLVLDMGSESVHKHGILVKVLKK